MKLKGLSLGQIHDSFAYHSIEKLMWSTKQPCFSSWGKLGLSQRKRCFCSTSHSRRGEDPLSSFALKTHHVIMYRKYVLYMDGSSSLQRISAGSSELGSSWISANLTGHLLKRESEGECRNGIKLC